MRQILHTEGEVAVVRSVRISNRCEHQKSAGDLGSGDYCACQERNIGQGQGAVSGQSIDAHATQRIPGIRIGETEVGGRKCTRCVLVDCHYGVGADRCVVDRGNVHEYRIGGGIESGYTGNGCSGVIAYAEGETCVRFAVLIRRRRIDQSTQGNICRTDDGPLGDIDSCQSIEEGQGTRAR